jgi:hypothetical protein
MSSFATVIFDKPADAAHLPLQFTDNRNLVVLPFLA